MGLEANEALQNRKASVLVVDQVFESNPRSIVDKDQHVAKARFWVGAWLCKYYTLNLCALKEVPTATRRVAVERCIRDATQCFPPCIAIVQSGYEIFV